MYTNTIIGSYNAIANSEHHAIIMKPPTSKAPPKKSNSKEHPHGHGHGTPRGGSEESGGAGGGPGSKVTSPEGSQPTPKPQPSAAALLDPNLLPGLGVLLTLGHVDINPDQVFSPEVRKMGFGVEDDTGEEVLRCLPSDSASSRSLLIQSLEGRTILTVNTETPYCCSWYKNLEAKVLLPDGSEFGSILKTAFGPCKCSRRFLISCQKTNRERVELEVEVHLTTPTEFLIKEGEETVARVSTRRTGFKTAYRVTFVKPELSANLKAIFIVFAIILHIAFAEKLNTCFGMCLCCCAGSSLAALILCSV